jgi:hypothetical protein
MKTIEQIGINTVTDADGRSGVFIMQENGSVRKLPTIRKE